METSLGSKTWHNYQVKFLFSPVFRELLPKIIDFSCMVQVFMNSLFVRSIEQEGKSWSSSSVNSLNEPEQNAIHWSNHVNLIVLRGKRLSLKHFFESQAFTFCCKLAVKSSGYELFIRNLDWNGLVSKGLNNFYSFLNGSLGGFGTLKKLKWLDVSYSEFLLWLIFFVCFSVKGNVLIVRVLVPLKILLICDCFHPESQTLNWVT